MPNPTGWLSFCPLHAAATIDSTRPTGRRYAIDELCVTYVASARARVRAMELERNVPDAMSALVVADPQPTSMERSMARSSRR